MKFINFTGAKRNWKKALAVITSFLILAGTGIIVNVLILGNQWELLKDAGIFAPNPAEPQIYFIVIAALVFFIVELNRKIANSSVAIGLVLSIVFSLPTLLDAYYYPIGIMIPLVTIIGNLFSITLASYVFDMMWT